MFQWLLLFSIGAFIFSYGLWRNRRFDRTKVAGNMLLLWVGALIMFTVGGLVIIGLAIAYLAQFWFPDGFV